MAVLSISRAWEESKAQMAADGRLMSIVAAALIILPGLIIEVVSPDASYTNRGLLGSILTFVTALLQLVGQLAIIRLAMTPSVSVGEAIAHGARRMPIYLLAAIILTIGLVLLMIPFGIVLYAAGVPLDAGSQDAVTKSPTVLLVSCLFVALLVYLGVRMLMSSPVASEEDTGPVGIIRRSWELTAGHWWRLFGFMFTFLVGALVILIALNLAVKALVVPILGQADAMSVSALIVGLFNSVVGAGATVVLAVMLARIYLQLAGREGTASGVPISGT